MGRAVKKVRSVSKEALRKGKKAAQRVRSASKEAVRRVRSSSSSGGGGGRSQSSSQSVEEPSTVTTTTTVPTTTTTSTNEPVAPTTTTARRSPRPLPKRAPRESSWASGPGYTGDREYWTRGQAGYGQSRQWAQRYAWWPQYVPYESWYIWQSWLPQYTLNESYALDLRQGRPVPVQALAVDRRHFPDELPTLPSFTQREISVEPMRIAKSADQLGASEKQQIEETLERINEELARLRRDRANLTWLGKGYMIVPDLDTGRFTWIKNANTQSDLSALSSRVGRSK
jgi:hypothetical protein